MLVGMRLDELVIKDQVNNSIDTDSLVGIRDVLLGRQFFKNA